MGRKYQPFTQETAAKDENQAVEKVLSVLGSKHRTKRKFIRVKSVEKVALDDVSDPLVAHLLREG